MITIYKTAHCPMCNLLIQKLQEKKYDFNVIEDTDILKEKNITFVPVLEYKDQYMQLKEALQWIENGGYKND